MPQDESAPYEIAAMGSYFFAGRVDRSPNGETFHGDHGYVQYFKPRRSRDLAMVLWHGLGQSGKTWESTPDGREGFWQMLLRRGWPVYIIDQPRRGRAGRAILESGGDVWAGQAAHGLESSGWTRFRLGRWNPPDSPWFYPGVSFPQDPRSVDQFFRQQTPNTGPEPFPDVAHRQQMGQAVAELAAQVGPCVLMTHSHSGQYGWVTAIRAPGQVKAVIALEPGQFTFPEDEVPAPIATSLPLLDEFMAPQLVSAADFETLTRIPVLIVLGDNIAHEPSDDFGIELRRMVRLRAAQMVAALNARGGDAELLELPQVGLTGNTHFMMSDLNNASVLELLCEFLLKRGLGASWVGSDVASGR